MPTILPVAAQRMRIRVIADYWAEELARGDGVAHERLKREIHAEFAASWWRAEIVPASSPYLDRLALLKAIFNHLNDGIGFYAKGTKPIRPIYPTEKTNPDIHDRIQVPLPGAAPEQWTVKNCASAFEALAAEWHLLEGGDELDIGLWPKDETPNFRKLAWLIEETEITREGFFKWLESRGYPVPQFWADPAISAAGLGGPEVQSKQASRAEIDCAISECYIECDATGEKPPNVNEIGPVAQRRLQLRGLTASKKAIQKAAGTAKFALRRRPVGKTVRSEQKKGRL